MSKRILQIFLFYAVIPFIACIPTACLPLASLPVWLCFIFLPGVTALLYCLFRRRIDFFFAAKVNSVIVILLSLCILAVMLIGSGSLNKSYVLLYFIFPFFPMIFVLSMMGFMAELAVLSLLTYLAALIACLCLSRRGDTGDTRKSARHRRIKLLLVTLAVVLVCGTACQYLYSRRPEARYSGHGFAYMHGYSSTDFSDYMVYSEPSKLALLDHPAGLVIENEKDMPVMDGAEACYPLYSALAKAVYRDIDVIESNARKTDTGNRNGRIVTFSNTVVGFVHLLDGSADLFFGARPSAGQLELAAEMGVQLEITTIGREGFVFFVEEDNPVDDLTDSQIRAIYHGDITNWKEAGGRDQDIVAFQRPADSGSQTMMEYFMGDIPLKEPKTYETVDSMVGVISHVAQYANEEGAMGYSFRYFLEGLNQEKGVKLLSVNGVAPTVENIENGSYPLTVSLCLITRKDDPNPYVQKMIDFILSADGQEIVRKTGYAGVGDK